MIPWSVTISTNTGTKKAQWKPGKQLILSQPSPGIVGLHCGLGKDRTVGLQLEEVHPLQDSWLMFFQLV